MVSRWIMPALDRLAFTCFVAVLGAIVFLYGVAVGEYKCFPYTWLERTVHAVILSLEPNRPHHLTAAEYDFDGARVHDRDAISPGVTLITGYWPESDWAPGIRVIDVDGNVLHAWDVDPSRIWPDSPHDDHTAGTKNVRGNYVHGTYLFPNGDVLLNIEYLGLVRMNAGGEVVWKLPLRTHHSITRDEDGNFWVCGTKWLERRRADDRRRAEEYSLEVPVTEDFAVKVSPEGKVLREISLLDALHRSGQGELLGEPPLTGDILHTNDVEPLPTALADAFPAFNAGDLLISCREINTIFVLDPETERIKWLSRSGIQQHDPDFLPDGTIQVFDNRRPWYGGSRIFRIHPADGTIYVDYPHDPHTDFLTMAGGQAQRLPGGNLLITEARRGRVFEVDRDGRLVWEWVAPLYGDDLVPEVLEGTRYPLSPEQVTAWSQ